MKVLLILLFLVSCSKQHPSYKLHDCVLLVDEHFYAGQIFALQQKVEFFDDINYIGCRVTEFRKIDCQHFKVEEIKQTVDCPFRLE